MTLEIKPFHGLPCELEVFTINGINADVDDFGKVIFNHGSCMENECGCEFQYKLPTDDVIAKYGITLDEYGEITSELNDKLYVYRCGWCS